LPFSPHKGQIASFSIRAFTDGNAAGGLIEQQSDIGDNEMIVDFSVGFRSHCQN
jgi:hypothetical protein